MKERNHFWKPSLIYRAAIFAIALALIISACSGTAGPDIQIEDAWTRAVLTMETPDQAGTMDAKTGSANSAAYMRIKNTGNESDRLLKASSEIAEAVEIHISEMKEGVMSMHPVENIEVPARDQVELKPGGLHVMLIGLKKDLHAGEQINLILHFEKSGDITIQAEVRNP